MSLCSSATVVPVLQARLCALSRDSLRLPCLPSGAGHAASPEPRVPFDTNVEVAPYVRALESEVAAVSFRVYERGRSCYKNNDMWCGLFMSSERANELHAANKVNASHLVLGFCGNTHI